MGKSVRDQMLAKGLVRPEETPEARRAAARSSRPDEPEKALPPPFEAPARGVIVSSRARPPTARVCVECGAPLAPTVAVDRDLRCAECSAG